MRIHNSWRQTLIFVVLAASALSTLGLDCGTAAQIEFGYSYGQALPPPQWSADGEQIVLMTRSNIAVIAVDRSMDPNHLHTKKANYDDVHAGNLAPDGSQIVYMRRDDGGVSGRVNYELVNSSIDGSNYRRLTDVDSNEINPVWSPDRQFIAFWSDRTPIQATGDIRNESAWNLFIMETDGSQVTYIAPGSMTEYQDPRPPIWSPDGRQLAFVLPVADDETTVDTPSIFVVKSDGSVLRKVASTSSIPAWSPDSRYLAYSRLSGDIPGTYVVLADGAEPIKIADSITGSYLEWSPTGTNILVSSSAGNLGAPFAFGGRKGTHVIPVTGAAAAAEGIMAIPVAGLASWSPDGQRIAAFDNSANVLSIANKDGRGRRIIAHSPDGSSFLVFRQEPIDITACSSGRAVRNPERNPALVHDCEILLAAFQELGGTRTIAWDTSTFIGDWAGIEVSGSPPRVTGILSKSEIWRNEPNGSGNNQSGGGYLPPELAQLTRLSYLVLSHLGLSGTVPAELEGLSRLEWLDLSFNRLSGEIPPRLGQLRAIESLDLAGNTLVGQIPSELFDLPSLQVLDLSNNLFSGEIVNDMFNSDSIERLYLRGNHLTGSPPVELSAMPRLEVLDLSYNFLVADTSQGLGKSSSLTELHLAGNRLRGTLPVDLDDIPRLETLSLGNNQLAGDITNGLAKSSSLVWLGLQNNNLTGSFPIDLSGTPNLDTINIGENDFDECVPFDLLEISNPQIVQVFVLGDEWCDRE